MFGSIRSRRSSRVTVLGGLVLIVAATAALAGGAQAAKPGNSTNAKACQKGNWETLYRGDGSEFLSEKECTSYAAQGGTLWPHPYGETQALCESFGGTFAPDNPEPGSPAIWHCNGYIWTDQADLITKDVALNSVP